MHSALLAVDFSDPQAILVFNAAAKKIEHLKGAERLSDNVWLLNFQISPAALAALVFAADRQGLAYRILPFDAEPRWIRGDPRAIA